MRKKYTILGNFLEQSCQHGYPQAFLSTNKDLLESISDITCSEENIASLEELSSSLQQKYIRPDEERRLKGHLFFKFKCAIDTKCSLSMEAQETENHSFILQTSRYHSCPQELRHFNKETLEIEKFTSFVEKLKQCLSPENLDEANTWQTSYLETSTVYKQQQNFLHQYEDEAINSIWGLPCAWRRSRGEQNIAPQNEDLVRLESLAKEHNMGEEILFHIKNNLDVPHTSSYFQQRGYFILLSIAPQNFLHKIITKRIQIMCYALNLLQKNMFLLCYKKLNPTALRNHAMMIALLLMSLAAQKGENKFPIFGTTQPIDSDIENLYEILNQLPQNLFVKLGNVDADK